MAKPTLQPRKITANPSHLVDCPPSSERTRLRASHKTESSETDMQMMNANEFRPTFEISAGEALSVAGSLARPMPTIAWISAMDAWRTSDAARKAYGDEVWKPAWDAAESQRLADEHQLQCQIATIPHFTTETAYESADGEMVHMTTATDLHIRAAMSGATGSEDDNFRRCCRELIQGIAARFVAEQEIRDRFEFNPGRELDPAVDAEMTRLEQIDHEAWEALTRFPAATLGELVAKTEFLRSLDCEIDHNELLADLTRIWNGGRSLSGNGAREWQDAMAAFQVAKEASDNDIDSDAAESLCEAMVHAADYLREVPAPDLAALEWKVEYLRELAAMLILEPTAFDIILADIRRLAARSAAGAYSDGVVDRLSQNYHRLFSDLAAHPYGSTHPHDPQMPAIDADHTAKNTELEQAFSDLIASPVQSGRDIALKLEAAIRHYEGASIDEDDLSKIAADARTLS